MAEHANAEESLVYDVLDLVFAVAEQTEALLTDTVGDLGLTAVMANTLWKIEPPATPSMRQLAASLGCDPSTVTFIADRLQDKGLITREIDPANRRAKIVTLTERGLEVRRQLGTAMLTRSPVAHLSPPEQRQLSRLLTKVARAKPAGIKAIADTD
ncbi:MarR family winged helix-turn-helix transcriptional regulator [Nocardia sp. NPDC088792]|uniref:MarR family winged helix-turn-helix transcriptional regulator n=1 Tax=Nocardia sp. NPDC088792 TaxID=3364332 RepID=UPI00382E1E7E